MGAWGEMGKIGVHGGKFGHGGVHGCIRGNWGYAGVYGYAHEIAWVHTKKLGGHAMEHDRVHRSGKWIRGNPSISHRCRGVACSKPAL